MMTHKIFIKCIYIIPYINSLKKTDIIAIDKWEY